MRGFSVLPHKKLITKILQRYWRYSRGLSLEVRACAQRWLAREGAVEVTAAPRLYSIYAGKAPLSSDQIAVYIALSWREQPTAHDKEMTRAFFAPGGLPQEMDADTLEWLNDAQEARTTAQVW